MPQSCLFSPRFKPMHQRQQLNHCATMRMTFLEPGYGTVLHVLVLGRNQQARLKQHAQLQIFRYPPPRQSSGLMTLLIYLSSSSTVCCITASNSAGEQHLTLHSHTHPARLTSALAKSLYFCLS